MRKLAIPASALLLAACATEAEQGRLELTSVDGTIYGSYVEAGGVIDIASTEVAPGVYHVAMVGDEFSLTGEIDTNRDIADLDVVFLLPDDAQPAPGPIQGYRIADANFADGYEPPGLEPELTFLLPRGVNPVSASAFELSPETPPPASGDGPKQIVSGAQMSRDVAGFRPHGGIRFVDEASPLADRVIIDVVYLLEGTQPAPVARGEFEMSRETAPGIAFIDFEAELHPRGLGDYELSPLGPRLMSVHGRKIVSLVGETPYILDNVKALAP